MLKLTRPGFDKIKHVLLRQQKEVEADLKALEAEDPVMDLGLAESTEPGTDSWMADTHGRVVAMRQNLQGMLSNIKKSITNINSGKYGKCENCHKEIEPNRLSAVPSATLCLACSKRTVKP